ncbi:MAG: SDR family NAD(P)-dependent oxidoreductase [Spirochaetaceae bacterium]|nr:SDR family NAD(P)-dependent oxidoreductase [Spirochaetaceae bacterium]
MDRLTFIPILRGAFMEALGGPVIILSEADDSSDLTDLKINLKGADSPEVYDSAARTAEAEAAQAIVSGLTALKASDGSLPAALRVPGFGSFFAGADWAAADSARKGNVKRLSPFPPARRGDPAKGRIALVTGGAQGFGAEIARGLVSAGAFVIVADINAEGAQAFADELNAGGVKCASSVAVDVSNEDSVKAMADAIVAELGGLDLLVSNAGVLRAGSVLELSASDFEFVTKINYSAFFLVVKQSSPIMIRQRLTAPSFTSDIIQVNSKSGLEGSNKNGAYAGGKFGGIGLVQSFAMELVEYGIKVNAICPGNFFDGPLWSDPNRGLFVQYLNTGKVPGAKSIGDVKKFYENKVPMGRGCEGEDVLKAILYAVDQAYETGQAIPVTGGQVMLK